MADDGSQYGNDAYAAYIANNANVMNVGQTGLRDAINTAQNNFQQQMAVTLQGTMAAAMAIYNTGKSVTDKAREYSYGDQLISQGNYVLGRSMAREALWGFGIAQTDLGRALQIGGRRPEFMTGGELSYQMDRAGHHGQEEFKDMLISGGGAIATAGIGQALGGTTAMAALGMTGAAGFIAPIAIGAAVTELAKPIIQPYLDQRKAVRDMAQFTEMADLNYGTGQRRMSTEASADLATRFLQSERSGWRDVPLIGGMVAGRLESEEKKFEIFKKMSSMNMFKDVAPDDVNKIDERVKKTLDAMDKFAAAMHTTRDAVLNMKGAFTRMGLSDTQQNSALHNVASFTQSTGLSADYAMNYYAQFTQAGYQSNFYNSNNGGIQGKAGLNEIAAIKAMQESGAISKLHDAGTLGMQYYQNAATRMNTTWGKVTDFGGGDVGKTADYYNQRGGGRGAGSTVLGMQMENLDQFGRAGNPLDKMEKNLEITAQRFRDMGMDESSVTAALISQGRDKTEQHQIYQMISGQRGLGKNNAKMSEVVTRMGNVGYAQEGRSFKLKDIFTSITEGKLDVSKLSRSSFATTGEAGRRGQVRDLFETLMTTDDISKQGDKDLFNKYQRFTGGKESMFSGTWLDTGHTNKRDMQQFANAMSMGDGASATLLKEKLINEYYNANGIAPREATEGNRKEAERVLGQYFKDNKAKTKEIHDSLGGGQSGDMLSYLASYEDRAKTRLALDKNASSGRIYDTAKQKLQGKSIEEVYRLIKLMDAGKWREVSEALGLEPEMEKHVTPAQVNQYIRMALDDTLRGLSGLKDTKNLKNVIKNFDMMSKDDAGRKRLESAGIKTSGDYVNMFKSLATDVNKAIGEDRTVWDKDVKKDGKFVSGLSADLYNKLTAMGLDSESVGKAIDTMRSSPEIAKNLMNVIASGDTQAVSSAVKNLAEGKVAADDDATTAIKTFTTTLKDLTDVLKKI